MADLGAADPVRERYYEHRAPVYDETSYDSSEIAGAMDHDLAQIGRLLQGYRHRRVLEVGCGTAMLTKYLPSDAVALDQSMAMLHMARRRVPHARLVRGRSPHLPFCSSAFDLLFAANFFGLLRSDERASFLAEAHRLATELVVVDLRARNAAKAEGVERRNVDGTTYEIYRRRFNMEALCTELDGEPMYVGTHFLMVHSVRSGG